MKLKEKIKRTDGFIAIMALGIFALLTIFGVIIQSTILDTFNSIQNTNNYYAARDLTDGITEYTAFLINQKESGYNSGKIVCGYGSYAPPQGGGNPSFCQEFDSLVSSDTYKDKNIEITVDIKGRSTDTEKFKGSCPGIASDCYVVPFPGTGDAGDRCQLYNPTFDGTQNSVSKKVDHNGQINDKTAIAQLDYSCNWNRLTFGSSLTDRVAIPFYYDTGQVTQAGDPILANPFHKDTQNKAENFVVRIRPPCLPCIYSGQATPGQTRLCTKGSDPTICKDNQRYVLDEKDDNLIVQWQLTGLCGSEQCGMIEFKERDKEGVYQTGFSGITEKRINNNDTKDPNNKDFKLLYKPILQGIDTSSFDRINILHTELGKPAPKLPQMSQPVLTLFLNEKLLTAEKKNIPYLEYQVLTDKPIGDSQLKINVSVNVDGNLYEKTIVKKEKRDLIDFAVQN